MKHQVKQNKCANRWYTGIPWNTTHWWRLPSVFKEHHSNFRKISWFSRSILWSVRPLPCLPGYQHYLQASSSSKTQQVLESVNHCRWQETLQKLQWWTLYVSSIVYLQQHTSRPTFLNQERCIEIRHTKLFVMCFQPSYHQIGSPRSH